ncbi:MAG TPA: hypothetical protein VNO17_00985 [Actinomycetota bacterium]|nr:hypothetical protein [Actinomycetota bacterium]
MRRATAFPAAVLVLALTILAPTPAAAKTEEERDRITVLIAGPGLAEPVRLRGAAARRVLYLTTFRGVGLAEPSPPPARALGPAYLASYLIERDDGLLLLVQDLYPYAAGMAWAYTPPDQRAVGEGGGFPVGGGWWHSVALLPVLLEAGLPERPPAPAIRPSVGAPTPRPTTWLLGLGLALALVAAAAATRRRLTARA